MELPPNLSFERARSAVAARFAVRRWWRAAQLMSGGRNEEHPLAS